MPGHITPEDLGPGAPPVDLVRQVAAPGTPLGELLAQREHLESQMASLTAPADGDPRFPVTSLAERRAEIERWARARERRRPTPGRPPSQPSALPRQSGLTDDGLSRALPGLSPRSQLLSEARTGIGRWEQWKEQFTGATDRVGDYAERRDRLLDIDTGGSGDLFARADAARRRALERRAEQDREERRAEQAHQRAHERRMEQRRETERLDQRGSTGKD